MHTLTAVAVRQDTFIIESTESDPISQSNLHHDSIVVPVVEEYPTRSRATVLVPRKTRLSTVTQEHLNITNSNQIDESNKSQPSHLIDHKTRLREKSDLDASFPSPTTTRRKLEQQHQVNIIPNTLNAAEFSRGNNLGGNSYNLCVGLYRHSERKTATTPESASRRSRSERACVANSKLKQTLPLKSSPEIYSDTSALKVQKKQPCLPSVADSAHNFSATVNTQQAQSLSRVVNTQPAQLPSRVVNTQLAQSPSRVVNTQLAQSLSRVVNTQPTQSPSRLDNSDTAQPGAAKPGTVNAQHQSSTPNHQSSWSRQPAQINFQEHSSLPQTTRLLGALVGGGEPGVIWKAECNNYPTEQDKAHSKEILRDLSGNIAENITARTTRKVTSRMAKSNRFDDDHERFEDVLKERNDMLTSERVYRKRIRQLEEELKAMVNQCQALSDENKELRRSLDGIKKSGHNSNNSDALAKLTALESERASLVAAHEATLKQKNSLTSDNAKIIQENVQLESKVRELNKQVISLQYDNAQISDLQTVVKGLQHDSQALEVKVKSVEVDNEALTKSAESRRQELDELTRALQRATIKEADLRDAQEKLESAREENDQIKKELAGLKKTLTDSEIGKQGTQEQIAARGNTIEQLNLDIDKKDKLIRDLQTDLCVSKQEVFKLKDYHQTFTDIEKEAVDLRSKLSSLKAELDRSLTENVRLKKDREEMLLTIAKLGQENSAEADNGSRKYFRNWELEKERRVAIEGDLAKKKEEVKRLEGRLKEADDRLAELGKRVASLEDKGGHMGMYGLDESETDIQALKDGNMKLRQMLVERNIQLTNTKHEHTVADSLIRTLELKQKRAEVRLQQLSQRAGDGLQSTGQDSTNTVKLLHIVSPTNRKTIPLETAKNAQPLKFPKPQERPERRGRHLQPVGPLQTSHPTSQLRRNNTQGGNIQGGSLMSRSSKPGGEKLQETSSSLSQLETKPANSPQSSSGYFALYRVKQKRYHQKGY